MSTETRLLQEAGNWLTVEHAYHGNRYARHVIASRTSDEPCLPLAAAWLKRTANEGTRQALWAQSLLNDMRDRGLIEVARVDVLNRVAELKREIGA